MEVPKGFNKIITNISKQNCKLVVQCRPTWITDKYISGKNRKMDWTKFVLEKCCLNKFKLNGL